MGGYAEFVGALRDPDTAAERAWEPADAYGGFDPEWFVLPNLKSGL